MPRYVCLLRGINLGRRRVKMERLRELFEELEFGGVETYIASGNVIFDSPIRDAAALERRIESRLSSALGYEVPSLLRTVADLAKVAVFEAFTARDLKAANHNLHVLFLPAKLGTEATKKVLTLQTPTDRFRVNGRELYWLCHGSIARPSFSANDFGKALGMAGTMRKMQTVRTLVDLYG